MIGKPYMMALPTKISFTFHGDKFTLKSFSPKEVHADQLKMKEKREKEKVKKGSKRSLLISSQEVKKIMFSQKSIFIVFPKKTLRNESTIDNPKCLENLVKGLILSSVRLSSGDPSLILVSTTPQVA